MTAPTPARATEYRFAIIPSVSAEQPSDIRSLIDDVVDASCGAMWIEHAGEHSAVIVTERPESGTLDALLDATKDRGLAVYDMALRRLYDPQDSVAVTVRLGDCVTVPYLTRDLLIDLVERPVFPSPAEPFVIVSRTDADYIQMYRRAGGEYQLEYRDGGPESHFVVHTADERLVADVMWAWVSGDARWQRMVEWMFLDTDAADAAL